MFTGIVTDVGTITAVERSADGLRLTIASSYRDLVVGESIAVNGACLTVTDAGSGTFRIHAVVTTRDRTNIGDWEVGQGVNLERALAVGDRFGGHIVQGHVDGVGEVTSVQEREDAVLLDVRIPGEIARVSVPHGSVTLDGVSLTINAMPGPNVIQVALIPYTRDHTTLGERTVGDRVHVEGDVIGKFVERLVAAREQT